MSTPWEARKKRMVSTEPFQAPWMSMGVSRLRDRTYEKPSSTPSEQSCTVRWDGAGKVGDHEGDEQGGSASAGRCGHPCCSGSMPS